MKRWAWAKAVAAGLACAGFSAGQAPPARVSVAPPAPSSPPEATDGPREGDVIVMRTVGQPERKVKVLRVTRPAGGEALADLQDVATGARYTVPARMLTAKPKPAAPPAQPPLRHNPTRWNKATPPPAATPQTIPSVTALKRVEARPPARPKAEPPPPPPPAVRKPDPVPAVSLPAGPVQTQSDVPTPTVTPPPLERPKSPPTPITLPPTNALVPAATPPEPKPEVRPTGVFAPLPVQAAPPAPAAAADPMADETGPYLRDLFGALRPSVRERAATALAECRYGSRPEVKVQLAKAAAEDPSPDVRAHCVRLLSKLGYHESRYLDELAGWAESAPPPLKQAARDALARIAVKN